MEEVRDLIGDFHVPEPDALGRGRRPPSSREHATGHPLTRPVVGSRA